MTPEEFKNKMIEISKNYNIEERHMDADNLLCDVMESLGYEEGIVIYERMYKWFS